MQLEFFNNPTPEQAAEWRAFQARSLHQHPRQDPRFAQVIRATGKVPLFVMGRRHGTLCAAGLFALLPSRIVPGRFCDASALSGPVCDDADTLIDFLGQVARAPAFSKVDAIKITPYWLDAAASDLATSLVAAGWANSEADPVRHTGMIDLTCSQEDLSAAFSRSARRKVRLVEKADIEIRRITTTQDTREFYDRLNQLVLKRHGLTQVPVPEQEAMFSGILTDPTIGALWGAYHQSTFLGGLLIYRSQRTAHARRYVADADAAQAISNLRVAPSLWLAAMLWAKEQGCTEFDVEGYRLIEDKADPLFNVYEYKRELNPREVTRIAEHIFVTNTAFHYANTLPRRVKSAVKRHFPALASRHRGGRPSESGTTVPDEPASATLQAVPKPPHWTEKKKVILLKSALRRGVGAFVRQGYLTGADVLLRTHQVFRLDADDVRAADPQTVLPPQCREIRQWTDIPETLRQRLLADDGSIEWGARNWLDMGRRLWLGEVDGQVAFLCWFLNAEQAKDFWCPVPPDAEVIYQTTTLPEFRGRGLQVSFVQFLIRQRREDGIKSFFISCHAYNYTSYRNILKMGFRPIGYCSENRITRRLTWHAADQ